MREIKFRVFDTKENKMIKHFLGARIDYALHYWETHKHVSEPMQFTGMHDKNGTPIYEGDVVSGYVHFPEVNYIVCYDSSDYSCGFKCKQSNGAGVIDVWYKGLIVIGNIHQHAHLLEQNKC